MLKFNRNKASLSYGFTIVELLIVIVIIAILASITIVAYNGIQDKAHVASLKSDLENSAKLLAVSKINDFQYPDNLDTLNGGQGYTPGTGNSLNYQTNTAAYCLEASYPENNPKITFYVTNTNTTPTEGTCDDVPAIVTGGMEGGNYGEADLIAAGGMHACKVLDGQAYCWGHNDSDGELGNGDSRSSSKPVAVGVSGVLSGKSITSISAGFWHTCVVAGGQAYCWGYNGSGRLGDGSVSSALVPVAVSTSGVLNGKTVTAISAGGDHTCAIANGQAYCWGYNGSGQLGNNSTSDSSIPVAVDTSGVLNGKTVTAISAGESHTCAVANGQAYCWGYNSDGEVNYGSSIPTAVDTSGVLNGKTVTAISAGNNHTCGLDTGGKVYCWGGNWNGELGDNFGPNENYLFSLEPVAISTNGDLIGGYTASVISTGLWGQSCTVATQNAYCWGRDDNNQFSGNYGWAMPVPMLVTNRLSGKAVTAVSAGGNSICFIANGDAICNGSYSYFGGA